MSQQNQNNSDPTKIQLGVGWNQKSKTTNKDYISVVFTGSREQDEYEMILRRKSTQEELDLFDSKSVSITILTNSFKTDKEEDSRRPDYIIKAFLK